MKRAAIFFSLLFFALPVLGAERPLFSFKDPLGDDDGPGTYVYPTDPVYTKGSFDITALDIYDRGKYYEFKVTIAARIEDPWDSRAWGGNGFSLQMVEIYLDLDGKEGSGTKEALPGINAEFEPSSFWEKCIIISPQGKARLRSEIDLKASSLKDRIIIPAVTSARGNTLIAQVEKEAIGELKDGFGLQAIMQSNEGYPDKPDLLARKVNEYEGPHRFGGGSDLDCDPHVMDILVAPAKGTKEEAKIQHGILSAYKCDSDPTRWTRAAIPVVRAGK